MARAKSVRTFPKKKSQNLYKRKKTKLSFPTFFTEVAAWVDVQISVRARKVVRGNFICHSTLTFSKVNIKIKYNNTFITIFILYLRQSHLIWNVLL